MADKNRLKAALNGVRDYISADQSKPLDREAAMSVLAPHLPHGPALAIVDLVAEAEQMFPELIERRPEDRIGIRYVKEWDIAVLPPHDFKDTFTPPPKSDE